MYIKMIISIAGGKIRAVKKFRDGQGIAVLFKESSGNVAVMTKQGKIKFCNINQANMFLRRL